MTNNLCAQRAGSNAPTNEEARVQPGFSTNETTNLSDCAGRQSIYQGIASADLKRFRTLQARALAGFELTLIAAADFPPPDWLDWRRAVRRWCWGACMSANTASPSHPAFPASVDARRTLGLENTTGEAACRPVGTAMSCPDFKVSGETDAHVCEACGLTWCGFSTSVSPTRRRVKTACRVAQSLTQESDSLIPNCTTAASTGTLILDTVYKRHGQPAASSALPATDLTGAST